MLKTLLLAAALLACAAQAHADGYRRASPFEQAKAQCELFADQAQNDDDHHVYLGVLGSLMREASRHAGSYEQCMVLKGFVKQ